MSVGVVFVVAVLERGTAARVYTIHTQRAALRMFALHKCGRSTPKATLPTPTPWILDETPPSHHRSSSSRSGVSRSPRMHRIVYGPHRRDHATHVGVSVRGPIARKCNIMLICVVILSVYMYNVHGKQKEHTSIGANWKWLIRWKSDNKCSSNI